jgi:tetratricopeptide (TPR) repeat protein
MRGNAKKKKGDLTGAIEEYTLAITLNPCDPEVYFSRGNVEYDRGELDAAIADKGKKIWKRSRRLYSGDPT